MMRLTSMLKPLHLSLEILRDETAFRDFLALLSKLIVASIILGEEGRKSER
jgi:hypothetical protein